MRYTDAEGINETNALKVNVWLEINWNPIWVDSGSIWVLLSFTNATGEAKHRTRKCRPNSAGKNKTVGKMRMGPQAC